jgi:hypothetical protein
MWKRLCISALLAATFTSIGRAQDEPAATTGTRPCPGPATEAALIAVARAESSDDRVIDWMTACGVAFPVGRDALERLTKGGVSAKVAGSSVVGHYFYLLSNPSDELIARILVNARPGAVAPPFSVDDKALMTQGMATPEVTAIRTLLTRYLSARQLMIDPQDQRRAMLLDALPAESLATRFTVVAVTPILVGGQAVTIMFVDALHLIVDVHVIDGAVSFLRRKSLPAEARNRLADYYRNILQDPDYLR